MAAPLSIHLQSCAKTFADGTRVLEPLDLHVHAGETLVLLGPSGCGKTTTLRLIAGLEQPDAGGKVLFDGIDVTSQSIEARNVGMVFQSYALFPNMTVAENIGYGLRIRKLPAAEQRSRVEEMLAMMRIEALADRHIDQLSGGQRQRVALARALAVRPRALLLDEPLTALDAQLRDALRVEINLLLRRLNITTVYVTHDQDEAMALGDRIIVMSHGRVAQSGTPREIYHAPASAFVANFIGTMNRVQGHMTPEGFACAGGLLRWNGPASSANELLFRPEDVRIVEANEHADLDGSVAAAFFLGDRTRLFIDVGEAQPLVVESLARCTLQVGQPVRLQVDAQGLLAL
ncbi:ABC transporter ATP-binding protein [Herbaspirillum sp. RTI4]|nr:ABC transporter ATP-binding protein [Herbaspirillum sp. RTI4]MDY7579395.1 ABC transporter ATP-binding protein [Herbaspirillum sp. RTI4]MEA9980309.1 ABC transporter ATP-binding protein [Herbaspirillum sp. RTI4]